MKDKSSSRSGAPAVSVKALLSWYYKGAVLPFWWVARPKSSEAVVEELQAYGPVFGEQADITNREERRDLSDRLTAKHSDATLLVNAAGVFLPKPFLEHTEADYDLYLDLNKATFFLTQTVAKNIVENGYGGAIVNVGSMWAKQAVQATPSSAYSMAKAGLHSLTQHLAMELASKTFG